MPGMITRGATVIDVPRFDFVVGPEGNAATLASAIAQATAGQTICVYTNVTEQVTVDKAVTIVGMSDEAGLTYDGTGAALRVTAAGARLQGLKVGNPTGYGVEIAAANVVVDGCRFDAQTGVYVSSAGYAENALIRNCVFQVHTYGVRINQARKTMIAGCRFEAAVAGQGSGVNTSAISSGVHVVACQFLNLDTGISMNGQHTLASGCQFIGCTTGVSFGSGKGHGVEGSLFQGGTRGVQFGAASDCRVTGCTITSPTSQGVYVQRFAARSLIAHCLIEGAGGDGIALDGTSDTNYVLMQGLEIRSSGGAGVNFGASSVSAVMLVDSLFSNNTGGSAINEPTSSGSVIIQNNVVW